jgi:hypothetical protein
LVLACCHWLSKSKRHMHILVFQNRDSGFSDRKFTRHVIGVVFRQQRFHEGPRLPGCARDRELLWMWPQPHCCRNKLWLAIAVILRVLVSRPCSERRKRRFGVLYRGRNQGATGGEILFEHKLETTSEHGRQRMRHNSVAERYLIDMHPVAFARKRCQLRFDFGEKCSGKVQSIFSIFSRPKWCR